MRALYATQSVGVRFFAWLRDVTANALSLESAAFYVAESMYFRQFQREHPTFGSNERVLREWTLLDTARRSSVVDLAYLEKRERALAQGPLWDALVCDRRIMLGRWCKERQDYRPRFSHAEMLRILETALREIEALFDAVRPDVLFGFVPATFGEYLLMMEARARGVPTLYLYPTKVRNYMAWMSSISGRPDHIVAAYHQYRAQPLRDEWTEAARDYLKEVANSEVRHEGMIPIPGKARTATRRVPLASVRRVLAGELEYWTGDSRHDNHVNSPIASIVQRAVTARLRSRRVLARLRARYVHPADLSDAPFAFYPLHAEPEVALSIQGRPYQNQIETVRNIARSLPVGMRLVVKEHPRSIGYHPASYYEKMLRIPGVMLADPRVEALEYLRACRLVVNVWSMVGFEAVLQRKPMVLLGTPVYGILPNTMVRHVADWSRLHDTIVGLLADYRYDEEAVVAYVAANMRGATPLNFYSRYLGKRGRYVEPGGSERVDERRFLAYTVQRVRDVRPMASATPSPGARQQAPGSDEPATVERSPTRALEAS